MTADAAQSVPPANGITAPLAELIALRLQVRSGLIGHARTLAGTSGAQARGPLRRGMTYAESRPYHAGDDVRRMDWRQSARRGSPFTKLFQEESERPVHLLVDLGPNMRFGTRVAFKSVLAARAAALLAWQAVADGDRIGGMVSDGRMLREVRPQAREHGALALLQQIAVASAAMPPASSTALAAALPAFRRSLRPGSLAVVLSDFDGLDANMAAGIAALARHNELVLVHIHDAWEADAPPPGIYSMSDFHGLDADMAAGIAALARHSELVLVHIHDAWEADAPPPDIYSMSDGERSLMLDMRSAAARAAHVAPYAARRALLNTLARQPRIRVQSLATHDNPAALQTCLHSAAQLST